MICLCYSFWSFLTAFFALWSSKQWIMSITLLGIYLQSCAISPCFNHIKIYLTLMSTHFHYFCPQNIYNLIKRILKVRVRRWGDYPRTNIFASLLLLLINHTTTKPIYKHYQNQFFYEHMVKFRPYRLQGWWGMDLIRSLKGKTAASIDP